MSTRKRLLRSLLVSCPYWLFVFIGDLLEHLRFNLVYVAEKITYSLLAWIMVAFTFFLIDAYRRTEKYLVSENSISYFKGGSETPKKQFRTDQIVRLNAEPMGLGYRRLIHLDSLDVITYPYTFENAKEFDEILSQRTGLGFSLVTNGQPIDPWNSPTRNSA